MTRGHSDDEKPHGDHDSVAPKDLRQAFFDPASVQFERVVAPRVSVEATPDAALM